MMGVAGETERTAMSLRCHSDITPHSSQQHNSVVCCFLALDNSLFTFSSHTRDLKQPKITIMFGNNIIIKGDILFT